MSTTAPSPRPPVPSDHITRTPGVCGGRPRLAGHRIRVQDVAVWYSRQGLTPHAIVERYPQLSLAQVHAALSYYYDHQGDIDRDIDEDERAYQELAAREPSLLDKVAQKRPDVATLSNAAAAAYVRSGRCPPEDVDRLHADLARRDAEAPGDEDLASLRE
jgi:uncharacterized protein (DUF433 family)